MSRSPHRQLNRQRSRLLHHVLLACLLLFAQFAGTVHGVAHGLRPVVAHGATHQHGDGVPVKVCDQCMAMAQVQPAPATVQATVPTTIVAPHHFEPVPTARCPRGRSAYRSRGPPGTA